MDLSKVDGLLFFRELSAEGHPTIPAIDLIESCVPTEDGQEVEITHTIISGGKVQKSGLKFVMSTDKKTLDNFRKLASDNISLVTHKDIFLALEYTRSRGLNPKVYDKKIERWEEGQVVN